jgi:hypothetical protein
MVWASEQIHLPDVYICWTFTSARIRNYFSPAVISPYRHDKGDGNPKELAVVRHAQSVVAGRGGNSATLLLLWRQHLQSIPSATLLWR